MIRQRGEVTWQGWKRAVGAWGPVLIYMVVIFVVSAQPRLPPPPIIGPWDKLQHALVYFGFGLIGFRGAMLQPVTGRVGPYVVSLLLGGLYGGSDEYHQSFVPGRTASGLDWLADILGVMAALAVIGIVRSRRTNGGKRVGKI